MKPFSSTFLMWCAIWILGSAILKLLIFGGDVEERFAFGVSTLVVAGFAWVMEHIEWKG